MRVIEIGFYSPLHIINVSKRVVGRESMCASEYFKCVYALLSLVVICNCLFYNVDVCVRACVRASMRAYVLVSINACKTVERRECLP